MPLRLHTDLFEIERYDLGEPPPAGPAPGRCVICQVAPEDAAAEQALLARGFAFLDRVLLMEIDLARLPPAPPGAGLPDTRTVCDGEFTPAMYALACAAYRTDRRFHLGPLFDAPCAAAVIRAYLEDFSRRGLKTYKLFHGEDLLGFTVVQENVPYGGKPCFENVLGATAPGIKGKMAAPGLYRAMMEGEAPRFRKYLGRVSAANTASLNLHYQQGARAAAVYDEFICRPAALLPPDA